jgi:hypothetical protein
MFANTASMTDRLHSPRIRLIKLYDWPWSTYQLISDRGSRIANFFLEQYLSSSVKRKPSPVSKHIIKKEYIKSKYIDLAFCGVLVAPAPMRSLISQIFSAIQESDINMAINAIIQGVDVCAIVQEHGQRVALHIAASVGDAPMVELLVFSGANPCAKDSNGFTPLWYATANRHTGLAVCTI